MTTDRIGARPLVVIESPFAALTDMERGINLHYTRHALCDSIARGEAPFAGHLLYPQVLDDLVPEDRALGISLHIEFLFRCDTVAVYNDLGISPGMSEAIAVAERLGKPIEYRSLK